MNEISYADDLVLMSTSTENLRKVFEIKRGDCEQGEEGKPQDQSDGLKSKVEPCAKCGKRLLAN